jgi:hypothetical protein
MNPALCKVSKVSKVSHIKVCDWLESILVKVVVVGSRCEAILDRTFFLLISKEEITFTQEWTTFSEKCPYQ